MSIVDEYCYYCPYCGKLQLKINKICANCQREIVPVKSKFERLYYVKKVCSINQQTNKQISSIDLLIREEASQNPLFDPTSEIKPPEPDPEADRQAKLYFENLKKERAYANAPKCPTCQSTNIIKISTASKVAGAAMFGLFSKTARSQFKCNNCGYKW